MTNTALIGPVVIGQSEQRRLERPETGKETIAGLDESQSGHEFMRDRTGVVDSQCRDRML